MTYNLQVETAKENMVNIRIEEAEDGSGEFASLREAAQAFLSAIEAHPELPITDDELRTVQIHASGRW